MSIFNFDNSYANLKDVFFAEVNPAVSKNPELVLFNDELAKELDIDISTFDLQEIASLLSGKTIPEGAQPLAMAYAGHQFGHFTMLGDGRAILLGEHITKSGKHVDIQLKGSGRTPFSRGGDGRATLRAMLREYLMSECMNALGVPSSRSLAVVKTGLPVNRETVHEGAVLTRIMDSHLRVGTFEFARQYLDLDEQKELLHYAIERHFPALKSSENPALDFLKAVQQKQLELIVNWMRIGFIHGVMNTDNMHIGGQTFDYGPCAFMNAYDVKTVFSSIDTAGRYAYGNQPEIALWNLSVLAGAILPQIHENQDIAVELARNVLNEFAENYRSSWRKMMCTKIGFSEINSPALDLIDRLLNWMSVNKADYTNTFLVISGKLEENHLPVDDEFKHWILDWKSLVKKSNSTEESLNLMSQTNPSVIPRNKFVEEALDDACQKDNYTRMFDLINAVKNKLEDNQLLKYQCYFDDLETNYKTFCGT
jgi:serine/tyrosine/threonine adenylyltransferase